MNTKIIAMALAAAAPLAIHAAPVAAQTLPAAVIVVVDLDRVFQTSVAGKQATAELKTRNEQLQARVTALQTQFGTEEQTLVKARPAVQTGPAETAWEAKVRDLQSRKQTAEQEVGGRNRDLQLSQRSVLTQFNDAVQPIITAVMKEHGASLVLPESSTVQHAQSLDITTDVLARLDKALPRISTATPAAPK